MLAAMTERSLEVLVGSGTFYEGPRWHEGRWWVSDFYRHTVFAITPEGEQEAVFMVDQQPSGLGWLPDTILSRSVIVRMRRRAPDEVVQAFRRRTQAPIGEALRRRLTAWAEAVLQQASEARP